MNKRSIKVTRSNKREKTVTISVYENNKVYARYKSFPLDKEDFYYYTEDATENDLNNFLRTDQYYKLK